MNENQIVLAKESAPQIAGGASLFSPKNWGEACSMAKALAQSTIVPKDYQGKPENCIIALEMAQRIGASVMMVMQNLYVIQGRPSWSSQFIISALNACGRFTPLRFELSGHGDTLACYVWATDAKGTRLEGPKVTMEMAKKEGWSTKPGSKWGTMPELMIRYRAAAFFGRLYAPDVLNGMYTAEENEDIIAVSTKASKPSTPAMQPPTTIDVETEPVKEQPKSATDKLRSALKETGLPSEESVVYSREPGMEG